MVGIRWTFLLGKWPIFAGAFAVSFGEGRWRNWHIITYKESNCLYSGLMWFGHLLWIYFVYVCYLKWGIVFPCSCCCCCCCLSTGSDGLKTTIGTETHNINSDCKGNLKSTLNTNPTMRAICYPVTWRLLVWLWWNWYILANDGERPQPTILRRNRTSRWVLLDWCILL